ncbi:MAG TPA: lipid A export permease/ATP-binding protein MsbA [Steroidobacteraceae bacterium]|jgi:subfamily B ATP-binding cassette protein MsbA|nr:lipid A export permease/ATP-binding protein MsbA [Steroidobacteraceae bacterium]
MSDPSTPPPVVSPAKVYRRLLAYARPHRGMFLIGVLGMALFAATDGAFAYFVNLFMKGTLLDTSTDSRWLIPIGAPVLFLFRGIGDYMSNYFPGYVGRQVIKAIRRDLFRKFLHLPASYYDRAAGGMLLSRLTFNIEQVAEATTKSITSLIRDSLTIVVLISVMFYYNWQLATIVFALAPPVSWLVRKVSSSFRRYSGRIQASMGDITRVVKEALDGQRVIKVFNAQDQEAADFEKVNEHNRGSNMKLIAARATSNPVVQFIASLGLGGILYFAFRQIEAGTLNMPDFMSFLTATLMTTAPLKRLMDSFAPLQQGVAAGASIFEVLDEPAEQFTGGRPLQRLSGALEFRNVSFEYSTEKGGVLHSVSLDVPAGKTIAIVGRSGSGKSTLVGLVPRIYDTTAGQVLVDGIDVRECNLRDLRANVALVSQDVLLFNDSIRNNIAFGVEQPDPKAVEAAAKAAYVDEFAAELPKGMDTDVGDRGTLLSGGQRQRIAIARALLKDAPILILDEAMSALDNESERRIQQALVGLMRNRTTLVIAHRLTTIEHADEIIVMEDGRIVERGTHAELAAREGAYASLRRAEPRH